MFGGDRVGGSLDLSGCLSTEAVPDRIIAFDRS